MGGPTFDVIAEPRSSGSNDSTLDINVLVAQVETAFQIGLDEKRAAHAKTLGELHRQIVEALGSFPSRRSQAVHWLFRLRWALTHLFQVPRKRLGRTAPMDRLLPRSDRRRAWRRLSEHLGHPLPSLRRPSWMEGYLRSLLILCAASLMGSFTGIVLPARGIGLAIGFALALSAGYFLTLPLADHLPGKCKTLETTLQAFLEMNRKRLDDGYRSWDPEEVSKLLRQIVARAKGVPPTSLSSDSTL